MLGCLALFLVLLVCCCSCCEASATTGEQAVPQTTTNSLWAVVLVSLPLAWWLGSKAVAALKQPPPVLKRTLVTYHPSAPYKSTRCEEPTPKEAKQQTAVVVTGGCGFLGSHLVEALLEQGEGHVFIFDVAELPVFFKDEKRITLVKVDISSIDDVRRALMKVINQSRGATTTSPPPNVTLFHVAAIVDYWRRMAFEWPIFEKVNVVGTRNLVDACEELIGKRPFDGQSKVDSDWTQLCQQATKEGITVKFVAMSTSHVVINHGVPIAGGDESLPYSTVPSSHYGKSKAIAEKYVLESNTPRSAGASKARLLTGCVRTHGLFGPRDAAIAQMTHDSRIAVCLAKPETIIDWVYVENAAYGLICLERKLGSDNFEGGSAFFISNGEPMNFQNFYDGLVGTMSNAYSEDERRKRPILLFPHPVPRWLLDIFGSAVELLVWLTGDKIRRVLSKNAAIALTLTPATMELSLKTSWFSIEKAKKELGYKPLYSMEEAWRRCAHYYASPN